MSFQLHALNANSHSAQKTVRLSCPVEYLGSQLERALRAELAHKYFLIEFQFLHLPQLRFSLWVTWTPTLSCAASFRKYFPRELSLQMPVVETGFSAELPLESAKFTFVNLVKIFYFFPNYSSQPFLTLDFIFQVALQNTV